MRKKDDKKRVSYNAKGKKDGKRTIASKALAQFVSRKRGESQLTKCRCGERKVNKNKNKKKP